MLKAVIFDFDGVIADSELLHYKALNIVFADYGVTVPKEIHWEKYLGFNDFENIQAVSHDYQMNLGDKDIELMIQKKLEYFIKLAAQEVCLIDGAVEFINMLKSHDVPMAICSGAKSEEIELMLSGSEIENAFELIVCADDIERGKPDPQGYLIALSRLNDSRDSEIVPSECVVIEDSPWGLQAALAAGMHSVGVTNTYSKAELAKLSEKTVAKLSELSIDDLRIMCS